MNILSVSSPRWGDAEHSRIDCILNVQGFGEAPFTARGDDPEKHGLNLYLSLLAGEHGAIADYVPPPTPPHEELVAATLAKARALRLPIMQVLDGMQASANAKDTLILVNGDSVRLDLAIEDCKQALRDLPDQVDLSQCNTQQQMEAVVLLAYKAIVDAAPPEIKSAFDSLKP